MNKEVYDEVQERSKGLCELCGSNDRVQMHHILGGNGRRKQLEAPETVIALCYEHHHGNYGCHGKYGLGLNILLRKQLQGYYKAQGNDEDTVRFLMGGKLY